MAKSNGFTSLFVNFVNNIKRYIFKSVNSNDIIKIDENTKEQASLWLSKIERGLSNKDKLELLQWAKQNAIYQSALFSLAKQCNSSQTFNELSALFPLEKPTPQKSNPLVKYAIALSFGFVILLTGNFLISITTFEKINNDQQFVEIITLQTEIGKQTRFSLSDGSRIKLNTNSLVNVSFSKNKRLLTLVRGEANFTVAKDKSRPFTVIVGEKSFTALGTIFNIQKTTDKDMELVVTEGQVLVTESNKPLNETATNLANFSDKIPLNSLITAGKTITIENNIQTSNQKISFEQIQRKLAWQQGRLVFYGRPLNVIYSTLKCV